MEPSITNQIGVKLEPTGLPISSKTDSIAKSITELGSLSTAIQAFISKFDDLQKHMEFIETSIDSCSNQLKTSGPPQKDATATRSNHKSEVQKLCETMNGKGLKKYVVSNFNNIAKLREEVPSAIILSANPARLVMECVGRFFLQGSRAFTKDSNLAMARDASILVLELFLTVKDDEMKIENGLKEEAATNAIAWMKRLIAEGGVGVASELDARGLLLYVACFGIPRLFSNENVFDLIRIGSSKRLAGILARSAALVARVEGILEGMLKTGMKFEAVDVASGFGMEEKFPTQKILSSFLQHNEEAFKRRRKDARSSDILLKEAHEKQMASLKSLMKFLEDRKLDPKKVLPGSRLKVEISKLEKDITYLSKKIDEKEMLKKRRLEDELANDLMKQEFKHPRLAARASPMISSPGVPLHDQMAVSYLDGRNPYGVSMPMDLADAEYSNYLRGYTSPVYYGVNRVPSIETSSVRTAGGGITYSSGMTSAYGAQSRSYTFHRDVLTNKAGQEIDDDGQPSSYGSQYPGSYAFHREALADRSGQVIGDNGRSGSYGTHSPGSYHREILADRAGQVIGDNGQPVSYGTHSPGPYRREILADRAGQVFGDDGQPGNYGAHSAGSYPREILADRVGNVIGSSDQQYRLRGITVDARLNDESPGHHSIRHQRSPKIEGFPGLRDSPPTGTTNHRSTSDLYRFADAVVEDEQTRNTGVLPSPVVCRYAYM